MPFVERACLTFASDSPMGIVIMRNEESLRLEVIEVSGVAAEKGVVINDVIIAVNGIRVQHGLHHDKLSSYIARKLRYEREVTVNIWRAQPPPEHIDLMAYFRPSESSHLQIIFIRNGDQFSRPPKEDMPWIALKEPSKVSSTVIVEVVAVSSIFSSASSPSSSPASQASPLSTATTNTSMAGMAALSATNMLLVFQPGDLIVGMENSPFSSALDADGLARMLKWFGGENGGVNLNLWRDIAKARPSSAPPTPNRTQLFDPQMHNMLATPVMRKNAATPTPHSRRTVPISPALSPGFWARDGLLRRAVEAAPQGDDVATGETTAALQGSPPLTLSGMLSYMGDGLQDGIEEGFYIARRASNAVVDTTVAGLVSPGNAIGYSSSSSSSRADLSATARSALLKAQQQQEQRTNRGIASEIGERECGRGGGFSVDGAPAVNNLKLMASLTLRIDHKRPWVLERFLWAGEAICEWRSSSILNEVSRESEESSWFSTSPSSPQLCFSSPLRDSAEVKAKGVASASPFPIRAVIYLTDRTLYVLHWGQQDIRDGGIPAMALKVAPWMLADTILPYYLSARSGFDEVAERSAEMLLRFHSDASKDFEDMQYDAEWVLPQPIQVSPDLDVAAGMERSSAKGKILNLEVKGVKKSPDNRETGEKIGEGKKVSSRIRPWRDSSSDIINNHLVSRAASVTNTAPQSTSKGDDSGALLSRALMLRMVSNMHRAELLEALCYWYQYNSNDDNINNIEGDAKRNSSKDTADRLRRQELSVEQILFDGKPPPPFAESILQPLPIPSVTTPSTDLYRNNNHFLSQHNALTHWKDAQEEVETVNMGADYSKKEQAEGFYSRDESQESSQRRRDTIEIMAGLRAMAVQSPNTSNSDFSLCESDEEANYEDDEENDDNNQSVSDWKTQKTQRRKSVFGRVLSGTKKAVRRFSLRGNVP